MKLEDCKTPADLVRLLLEAGSFYISCVELEQHDATRLDGEEWEAKAKEILGRSGPWIASKEVRVVKCPCGHKNCGIWQLPDLGSFFQGNGFTEAMAFRIKNALEALPGDGDFHALTVEEWEALKRCVDESPILSDVELAEAALKRLKGGIES